MPRGVIVLWKCTFEKRALRVN